MAKPYTAKAAPPSSQPPDLSGLLGEWLGKELTLAFPCYKYTNPLTAWILLGIGLDVGKDRIRPDMEIGDAMIYHARNKLAHRFMASGSKWILMIDDDMVPPIGRPEFFKVYCRLDATYPDELAGVHVVNRMLSHGKSLVGACYYGRHPNGRMISQLGQRSLSSALDVPFKHGADAALVEVDWVGTGCMLIHRDVFTAIQERFPELAPKREGSSWNYFQPIDDEHGEDVSFCLRAKAAGHQAHVDPGLVCMHVGNKAYGGEQVMS